ncbi:hypothetical protein J1G35_26735 [Pseudomonas sp. SH10-3B]|uniref:hypothetical protein n=1 Tax=Pseudomonas sp. SH10-3B TaxID=2816049 RepID=UPI001CA601E3|nr:hypothetical protein [Pseudomonas sp. SH10-3B]MBY8949463.1 hypothetical protein [Pseudomonas sp. SH10-3B]
MSADALLQAATKTSQVFNTPISATNTINAFIAGSATEADAAKFTDQVRSEINTLSYTLPELANGTVIDMFGSTRAQQAERQ